MLNAATRANPDNDHLSELLKVPLSGDGFFLEAHRKLRPVEFATDGIFLCGIAQAPRFMDENIYQAQAAAAKAMVILSKDNIVTEGSIAWVNEDTCVGCETCQSICPYGAIEVDEEKNKAVVNEALCKGCGSCASWPAFSSGTACTQRRWSPIATLWSTSTRHCASLSGRTGKVVLSWD